MLLIEYIKKPLTVLFLLNNHDIKKGDIQQHFWDNICIYHAKCLICKHFKSMIEIMQVFKSIEL